MPKGQQQHFAHWSLVIGHWSLVIGHWSFPALPLLVSDPASCSVYFGSGGIRHRIPSDSLPAASTALISASPFRWMCATVGGVPGSELGVPPGFWLSFTMSPLA